ncbi:ABC transporter substrate-binding protein [Brachybacterium sacelli]|uniref:Multiple sugar transport system substrate-binding protein n=1 Tax=Brachybacterium sacelli TaxID=173364 RepID=A0ABS4WW44_9MICO|nr:extracellular solute-binding protein [Brachybacterium sacelli]MBP2380417.1 multiple sugar transport system substrate-binding protein [Brachybacterium sacelli]
MITRRRTLTLFAAAGTLPALAACGPNASRDSGGEEGDGTLRFSWWGNPERAETTRAAIDLFTRKNAEVEISGEPADISGYFDKLATSVAAGDEPDVITMGGAYPAEYAARDVLLDLGTVEDVLDLSEMDEVARSNGQVDGMQVAVTTGINAPGMIVNRAVLEAAGVELPDPETWTWEDFAEAATAVSDNSPEGTFGSGKVFTHDSLDLWARQHGQILYTQDGTIGVDAETVQSFFEFSKLLVDSGASPDADQLVELADVGPERTLVGRGLAAFMLTWSSSLTTLSDASGADLEVVKVPGESLESGVWLQSSQFYTISARTSAPETAATFVDFLVSDPEAAQLFLTDRGVPAIEAVRQAILPELTDPARREVEYISALGEMELKPTWIGPAGSTAVEEITPRHQNAVLFGDATAQEAARAWHDDAVAAVTG